MGQPRNLCATSGCSRRFKKKWNFTAEIRVGRISEQRFVKEKFRFCSQGHLNEAQHRANTERAERTSG